ncbi:MAG TPA: trigger factor [Xanthobacteraceae bacterium]|jgi:trigger factor|nr:trigger factor [Xanthobacteraceae bacterium]
MQVTETVSEGLKREYSVVLPAAELDTKANERLASIKDRVNMPGFRPGKVPMQHLKRLHGKAIMGEVIEQAIADTNNKIISDHGLKLAMEPKITLANDNEQAMKEVIEGKADLAYTVAMEVLPKIELGDFSKIKIEKPVAPVSDEEVDEAIAKMAEGTRPYNEKQGKSADGDRVTISFVGKIDGVEFEGGKGDDVPVVLGSKRFIPGFEEQLIGLAAGESGTVKVKFPDDYASPEVAGKDAEFAVTVSKVEGPGEVKVDDEWAKALGLESLDKLKQVTRERFGYEHTFASRLKAKRKLLDELDKMHQFAVPPTLLEQEFNGVWQAVNRDMQQRGSSFEKEDTTEEDAKKEYREISDRRVRLGLVIAEIGEKNGIKVSEEEINRAIVDQARNYPGQEQQIWDYYRKNPMALAEIRSPIYEDKVIDFLLELAQVTEKQVTKAELMKEDDEEGGKKK